MNYASYSPSRYAPDPPVASYRGALELQSIASWVGRDKNQSILEVGCGCGNLLVALKNQGYVCCQGVDQDGVSVRYGQEILGVNAALGIWSQYLEKTATLHDVIIALDVLEHLPREELLATLKLTRSRLSPGGRLILRVPNALCPLVLPTLYGDLTHQGLFTPRTLVHLLSQSGFTGRMVISETRPQRRLRRILFTLAHCLVIRPAFSLAYYHFHGEFPTHLTPNVLCCAWAESTTGALDV